MWTIAVATLALIPAAARTQEAAAPDSARPNVLFIAVDDMNDWAHPFGGHPQAQTPAIDRLAQRGVVFDRAYCSAPLCNPSRASLLCGIAPSTSGVYQNSQPWRPVMPDAVTLPQHFMANGYRVVGGGKIFHGSFPERESWHEYFSPRGQPRPDALPANGIPGSGNFDWGSVDVADGEMGDGQVVDWAIRHLENKPRQPLFLAVGLSKPHLPWYVPRKYFEQFPLESIVLPEVRHDDLDDVPPIGREMAKPNGDHRQVTEAKQWPHAVQAYLASIAFADAQIGRLLDAFDKSPLAKNTIIVFWGDHGWHLGEKLHWRKFTLWEEADRVPLILVAPGVAPAASRCPRTVSLLDLYPTLCELCGVPVREGLEGRSIVPLLEDPDTSWDYPVVTTYGRGNHAVRSERWRYIRYNDGTEELYDHEADPMEWTNLAGDQRWGSVRQELAQWLPKTNALEAPKASRAAAE